MKVVAFLNSFIQGSSGGDVRFIEIMKRLEEKGDIDLTVVTSKLGKDFCTESDLNAVFKITTQEREIKNVVLLYARRIISTLFLGLCIKRGTVLYSTSDFLLDTFPAFIWKLRNKRAKWIVCIFLIVPSLFRDYSKSFVKNNSFSLPSLGRILYFLSQRLTIFLGKRWANKILVLNNIDKEYLVNNIGLKESLVSVVNGGVDYRHIQSLKTNKKILYDAVFLGRFHPQKGIFDLIKIWKLVCDKKPDAKLCIIGSGPSPLVQKVRILIKENNLFENVELVGFKLGDEKLLLLKSSRLFVCPSYYESFAIVIAEAMACGLPVVTYNLPIYEGIYGKNIVKVPLGSIHQFADAVITLLNNDNLREAFELEGEKFVERYNWDEIAEREFQLMIDNNR